MKINILNVVVFLFILAIGCRENKELNYIRIYQIGAIDQPIHTLLLSRDSIKVDSDPWIFNMVIQDSVLKEIEAITRQLKEDTSPMKGLPRPYQGFKVSICFRNETKCEDKRISFQETLHCYDDIIRVFKKNKIEGEPIEKLSYLQERIRHE